MEILSSGSSVEDIKQKFNGSFLWMHSEEQGPFTVEDIERMYHNAEVSGQSLIREADGEEWRMLKESELFELIAHPEQFEVSKEPLMPQFSLPQYSPSRPPLIAAWFCILLGLSALMYYIFGYAPPLEDAVHPRKLFVTGILVLSSIGSVLFGGLMLILDAVKESSRKSDK